MVNTKSCKLNQGDAISSLPDEILLIILSKLSIKEQAKTSVLSSRWIHLWTFSSCLNIDAEDFVRREPDHRIKTLEFINTADHILTTHRGESIDQLKITFPAKPFLESDDHLKVDIAKKKQVKALHLDLKSEYSRPHDFQIFSLGPLGYTTFSSLVTLRIENASLSHNAIHTILSISPNLLELSVIKCSGHLLYSKISVSSLKLKHLELVDSYTFFLEISAPNLVSFTFGTRIDARRPARITFKSIPQLTRLSCSLACMLDKWRAFYPLLPQIVTLTLTITNKLQVGDTPNFPVLTNLKQMHVRSLLEEDDGGRLNLLLGLFKASPCLSRLSFDLGACIPKHSLIENIAESCSSLQEIIIHSESYKRKVEQESVETVVKKLIAQKGLDIVFKAPNSYRF